MTRTIRGLDLGDLECFVAVAEDKHFGRAADRLAMTVSSVSKRCARLEQALGARLFDRSSRQVLVTPAGAVLVDRARTILSEADRFVELAHEAAAGRIGELSIIYSPGNGELVARIIKSFRSSYPRVQLRLQQVLSRDIGATVQTGRASIGVCRAVCPNGLRSLTLLRVEKNYVAMPADHRLAELGEVNLEDLAGETLLASDLWEDGEDEVLPAYLKISGISVRYEPWVTESQVMDSVAAGFGLTVLDEGFLERNPRRDVIARRFSSSIGPEWLADYLVWRPDETSEVVHQFVAIARSLLEAPA
jgi:DNA-binding transcriptional LysR family regulator